MVSLLDRSDIFKSLVDYQHKFGNPLGLSPKELTSWSKGVRFDDGNGTFIFTGSLYQMAPWMSAYSSQIARLESGPLPSGALLKAARRMGSVGTGVVSAIAGVDRQFSSRCSSIIRRASELLTQASIPHGYLGEAEPYSGVIFMELGMEEMFSSVANNAYSVFRERGVKRLITLDPHSTVALREWYPEFVPGFDIQVEHYLEVVQPGRPDSSDTIKRATTAKNYAIHDPCLLSRRLGLDEKLREGLQRAGIEYREPVRCRRGTFCCGGPIESVAPRVAGAITEKRKMQLRDVGDRALVACPVCLANLGRDSTSEDLPVSDVLEVL